MGAGGKTAVYRFDRFALDLARGTMQSFGGYVVRVGSGLMG